MKRQEAKLAAIQTKKYGRAGVPMSKKKGPLGSLGGGERKYFDSADYARGGNKATGKVQSFADPPSIYLRIVCTSAGSTI